MQNIDKRWLILILTFAVGAVSCARPASTSSEFDPTPVFVSDNPQSIYASDPNDSWNRIFRALFTRTVKHRMSDAFPEGAPFVSFQVRMGSFPLRLSKEKFSRTEVGDRAIEPLYPTFFTADGPMQVLTEPRFTELTTALREAIEETKGRTPVERALMQADVWAAYDILYSLRLTAARHGAEIPERRVKLLSLLQQFIRKLALSTDEIKSLKSNYLLAVDGIKLPDLFSAQSGWLEIELLSFRAHDHAASYRRATRVFVKPRTPPSDPGQFVESLKHQKHHDKIEAVALIIQNLLIDKTGRVVPSPLFSDVQFRFFKNDAKTGAVSAEPQQFELSRRKLLTEPMSGGFVEFAPDGPAFLSAAGNDLEFASTIDEAGSAIIAPLRTRCTQCHNPELTTLMTFSIHYFPPVPTTRVLKPSEQEHALYVAQRKEERDDFKSLF